LPSGECPIGGDIGRIETAYLELVASERGTVIIDWPFRTDPDDDLLAAGHRTMHRAFVSQEGYTDVCQLAAGRPVQRILAADEQCRQRGQKNQSALLSHCMLR
jgi:hypothetical protein